jgi:tryptophanyl-tRNA synthetase
MWISELTLVQFMTMQQQRILSGIQPTGQMHLGNYLGAMRHWVALQHDYQCFFMLADMHAITVPHDPEKLRHSIRSTAAFYIACGIDPDVSSIFVQSSISGHAELSWVLDCLTPIGWLNRMTQFKEKAGKQRDNASLGLYAYPVLMAADILLYKATHVPVGEDQKQHLELARDIAGAFNRAYNVEYFPQPEPLILGEAARVMSLRDGRAKMSKSDPSEASRLHLDDSAEVIAAKIKKAKSDMEEGIAYAPDTRPEAANLLTIYAAVTAQTVEQAASECASLNFAAFKARLSDAVIAHLAPITQKYNVLMQNPAYLDGILRDGSAKAALVAEPHMKEVKRIVGFY